MLAVGKGIYPADKHPDERLGKCFQTTSEDRFITSQLQICLLDQGVPFWNSLAKTTLSSSFICLGIADMLWLCCLHQQLLATCYHLKSSKLKIFKKQFLLLQTTFKCSRAIHQTVRTGNPSLGAESPGQQRCALLPEDPFQKEAILNSTHSWSQRLVLFQRPIPTLVVWNFFQIPIWTTLSTYKISPFSIF